LFLKSPPALILASTSAYRRALLERLGLPFRTLSPGVDETPRPGEPAHSLVSRLALAKANAVAAAEPAAWVIGSDQAAIRDGEPDRILGKPGSVERCIAQLEASSGRVVEFLTAVAVVRHSDGATHQFLDSTRVRFRALDRETIERYVTRESPLDCAGGFRSEGLGIALFEAIESVDPTALVGLPLIRLAATLREVGFAAP
jgi:septum formation protein